jgi:hypothetical protein
MMGPVSVQTERIDDIVLMHVRSPNGSVDIGFPVDIAKLVAKQLDDCANVPGRRDALVQVDAIGMRPIPQELA